MATKTFKVSLSLDNPRIIQTGIKVRSFDKQSIKIAIELTKNSQVYQIPTGAQIKISLLKLARQEQKIILDVPFTSADSIDWIVPDYLDGYQGEVRVGVYLIVGTENIDVGYFNITSSVSDIDSAAEEFTESVLQGWAIEDLTALLPKFQAVLDETTGKDVISAPEIIVGRGGYATLGERLDEGFRIAKNNVDDLANIKADKVYVDTVLSSIVSGGPKELFYSLNALKIKYPDGAEGTYLVFDATHEDGAHSYIWQDLSWVDLGVYQAAGIAKNAVGTAEINWIVNNYRLNLFDGVYVRGSVRAGSPFYLEGTGNPLYKMAVMTVQPNTKYYVLRSLPSRCNIATATKSIAEGESFDGAVSLSCLRLYPAYVEFTTGPNDKYVYISMSLDGTEPYLCISEEPPANNKRYYYNQPRPTVDIFNRTNLLESYNLFSGEYETDLQIQGAEPFLYNERSGGKVAVMPVKSNASYTMMRETPSRLNWGTATKLLTVGEGLDGTIKRNDSGTGTTTEPKVINFTTGPNDKFLYVNTSVTNTEPVLKIIEGDVKELGFLNYYEKKLDSSFDAWLRDFIDEEIQKEGMRVVKKGELVSIIYFGKNGNQIIYDFGRNIKATINLDVWRLITIYYVDGKTGVKYAVTEGDNEGVLKIKGEADYIGGVHGDEVTTDIKIYVDGIGINGDFDKKTSSVEFVVFSDIFRANSTIKAFRKIKRISFDKSGVHIKNKWKPLSTYQLEHVRGGILSIYKKTNDNQDLIKTFKTNIDDILTDVPNAGTTITMPINENISSAALIGGLITARLRTLSRGGNGNMGNITDFGTRLKIYIDSYTDETVTPETEIYEEHEFLITAEGIPFEGSWHLF